MIIDNRELLRQFLQLADNLLIQALFIMILFDVLTGIAKAITGKNVNSTKGINGLIKHSVVALMVVVAVPYLNVAKLDNYAYMFVAFFMVQYGISILENLGQLGIPMPDFVRNKLLKLQSNYNGKEIE